VVFEVVLPLQLWVVKLCTDQAQSFNAKVVSMQGVQQVHGLGESVDFVVQEDIQADVTQLLMAKAYASRQLKSTMAHAPRDPVTIASPLRRCHE